MTKEAFDKIRVGLEEALEYAKADTTPAAEALKALSIDTPSTEITPEQSPELNRLMSRMFMEF